MSDSITLSEKHGVNPALEVCFLCEKDIGVVLFGQLPEDKEAPKKVCLGHICEECEERLKNEKKVIFIEVDENLTGRYIEIPAECFEIEINTINYISISNFEELVQKLKG